MIALVDCNNFYASCERLFRPDLKGRPVIVLSNNDGCVIARSEEAKQLGVGMAVPAHEVEPLVKKHGIAVFSSNYALYGDMSRRVMATLSMFAPEIEVYSIDEAFLNLAGVEIKHLSAYAQEIVKVVTKNTGIPIGIGVAPTKTLAKVANRLTKRNLHVKGAWVIHNKPESIEDALRVTPIGDVWGIGWSHKKLMKTNRI
ncbi:MAG TPA: hypothetical protein VEC12_10855, partial [Bacteroidia bacterium]|nr:hypothetical protein [Bacteroidia bacterium]